MKESREAPRERRPESFRFSFHLIAPFSRCNFHLHHTFVRNVVSLKTRFVNSKQDCAAIPTRQVQRYLLFTRTDHSLLSLSLLPLLSFPQSAFKSGNIPAVECSSKLKVLHLVGRSRFIRLLPPFIPSFSTSLLCIYNPHRSRSS